MRSPGASTTATSWPTAALTDDLAQVVTWGRSRQGPVVFLTRTQRWPPVGIDWMTKDLYVLPSASLKVTFL